MHSQCYKNDIYVFVMLCRLFIIFAYAGSEGNCWTIVLWVRKLGFAILWAN
jgi:hypothetical protein